MARSTYDDFIIKEKIGSGSYGVVFKVVRKVDRVTYAMKEIDLAGMSRKEQEECIRETRVLSQLDSDYIIKYYDSFLERGKLYIITEYASNGNLHDYIKKSTSRLDEDLIWKLFLQILMGLNHMHSKKILHRDIKTLNVFLDENLNVKLGDMGVAKILSTQTQLAKTMVGTPYYLSPELCEDKPYNEKSDVWALGVVLYECCVQRHPFDADNQGALILKILRGKYPPVTNYSADVAEIIKKCLTQNAGKRPNTYKLLLQDIVRQKAAQHQIPIPDQATLQMMAERSVAGLKKAPSGRNMGRPSSARRPSNGVAGIQGAVSAAHDLQPQQAGAGVIRVVGDMNSPPLDVAAEPAVTVSHDDKAFVFGSTLKAGERVGHRLDVQVSGAASASGEIPGAADADNGPVDAGWRVLSPNGTSGVDRHASSDLNGGPQAPMSPGGAGLEGLSLQDEDPDEDGPNPYDNPYDLGGEDVEGNEEESEGDDYGEEEVVDDEYEGDEDDGEVEVEEVEPGEEEGVSSGGWQPDPTRVQHMRSAMMIQRAACLDLIGEKAFNELYALLKSNQVDEASMTDLSRLVFKIIPYDKSEVIQMMYKLLYLESQLEGNG